MALFHLPPPWRWRWMWVGGGWPGWAGCWLFTGAAPVKSSGKGAGEPGTRRVGLELQG